MSRTVCSGIEYAYVTERRAQPRPPEVRDFRLRDKKGRAIGYRIERYLSELTERDGSGQGGQIARPDELGIWFEAWTSATRNGWSYGGSSRLRARTEEELEALIEARVQGARARYAKANG